jgi:hypothetical protein
LAAKLKKGGAVGPSVETLIISGHLPYSRIAPIERKSWCLWHTATRKRIEHRINSGVTGGRLRIEFEANTPKKDAHLLGFFRDQVIEASLLGIRAALGAGAAFWIATYAGLDHPIYSLVAAIIVTEYSASETRRLGLQRVIGTFVGVAIALGMLAVRIPSPVAVGAGISLVFAVCRATNISAGSKIAAYICAIVILENSSDPFSYALHRTVETIIGVGVALGISIVPRLITFESTS